MKKLWGSQWASNFSTSKPSNVYQMKIPELLLWGFQFGMLVVGVRLSTLKLPLVGLELNAFFLTLYQYFSKLSTH